MTHEKPATALLSTWQRQVVADLGIDAWYLTPLQPLVTSDDKAHQQLIDGLLGSISEHDDAVPPAVTTSVPAANAQVTVTTAPLAESLAHTAATAVTEVQAPSPSMPANAPRAVGEVLEKTTGAGVNSSSRRVLTPPPTIRVDAQQNIQPPEEGVLSLSASPDYLTWTALAERIKQLAEQAQQTYCLGQGNQQAAECFIFPPSEPNHASANHEGVLQWLHPPAKQLLSEMLAAIGVDFADSYQTPVLKHATAFGQAPDQALLDAHLAVLASELVLVSPARIWLLGGAVCRAVMDTAAPLSALMPKHYGLSYLDAQQQGQQAQLICLPEPDYLLALPAEKGKVWQRLKSLSPDAS